MPHEFIATAPFDIYELHLFHLVVKHRSFTRAAEIADFLKGKYEKYQAVSYRLWILVRQLAELRNVYPGATLHDCDDGSDQNPVRLGSTALGNYTRKLRPKPISAAAIVVKPLSDSPPPDKKPTAKSAAISAADAAKTKRNLSKKTKNRKDGGG